MAKLKEEQVNALLVALADKGFRRKLKASPQEALKSIGWTDESMREMADDIEKIEVNVTAMGSVTAVGTNCNCT